MNPPATAALEPVKTVSESSRPGSLKWVCISTKPGINNLELPSTAPLVRLLVEFSILTITWLSISRSITLPSVNLAPTIFIIFPLQSVRHLVAHTKLPFLRLLRFLPDQ